MNTDIPKELRLAALLFITAVCSTPYKNDEMPEEITDAVMATIAAVLVPGFLTRTPTLPETLATMHALLTRYTEHGITTEAGRTTGEFLCRRVMDFLNDPATQAAIDGLKTENTHH